MHFNDDKEYSISEVPRPKIYLIRTTIFKFIKNLQLWVGFPSKYKMIPIALKKVQELGKKLYALLPESYKKKYEDVRSQYIRNIFLLIRKKYSKFQEDDFIFRWLCFDRMMKHVKENKKFFEIHKMTDEQIQKALVSLF